MMKGHKWECFFQELTFLPWDFLGFISIGIADVCFVRPYKMAVFGGILRRAPACCKKERGIPGSAQLNDRYLFEKAEEPLLEKAYRDVLGRIKNRCLYRSFRGSGLLFQMVRGGLEQLCGRNGL